MKRTHKHTWRCLTAGTVCDLSYLSYEQWVKLAADVPDQDLAWRSHELHGRNIYAHQDYDLGGEA